MDFVQPLFGLLSTFEDALFMCHQADRIPLCHNTIQHLILLNRAADKDEDENDMRIKPTSNVLNCDHLLFVLVCL